jgi:hypothetical protein
MMRLLPALLLVAAPLAADTVTAADIMKRVAENQTKAQDARAKYVFDMNVFVRLKRGNGKLAREESRDYVVAPSARKASRKLVKVEGRILDGKQESTYSEAGYRTKDMDLDGAITDSFAREVMWRKNQFGPMLDWFPMTAEHQNYYGFKLEGEEQYRGYNVYKIAFDGHGEEDDCWKGEALIEKTEFQPVLITSHWTCKIPKAATILLGITVKDIGAKITYQRFDKDVWFPVTCGGEMKLRLFFGYARTIAFSAKNTGFRKAEVDSSVDFDSGEPTSSQAAAQKK